MKKYEFPTAEAYSSEKAMYPPLTIVDIRSRQADISGRYSNQVQLDVNDQCMRLAVFEEEYPWHCHPESDELFLVVEGRLQIEFEGGHCVDLTEWQGMVVPAGVVHRTRAIGRTADITFEKQGAKTVFVDPPSRDPLDPSAPHGLA